jgi:ubiquinone/menaquinone biosynthesis C-methylase UbiE
MLSDGPERAIAPVRDDRATERIRMRYDRIAPLYDRMEAGAERRFRPWRAALWQRVPAGRVLELGVGTGKNFPHYPADTRITAIDFAPRMLAQAQQRARRDNVAVTLLLADAQALPFPDASFDTVAATFVFCSVPDPLLGLREAHRVLVPGGQLLLLEHVLSHKPVLRALMRLMNPLVVRLYGANISRETVASVERAGFRIEYAENLALDIVKLIAATHAAPPAS